MLHYASKHAFTFIFAQKVMQTKGNNFCCEQPILRDKKMKTSNSPQYFRCYEIKMKTACHRCSMHYNRNEVQYIKSDKLPSFHANSTFQPQRNRHMKNKRSLMETHNMIVECHAKHMCHMKHTDDLVKL